MPERQPIAAIYTPARRPLGIRAGALAWRRNEVYWPVLVGVDTLRVNAIGELAPSRTELFDALQARAFAEREARRGRRDELTVVTPWRLAGQPLLMAAHGGGKGQWRWLMRCPAARFDVGLGHLGGIVCQVTLNAPFLWRFGYRQAWAKVATLIASWCAATSGLSPAAKYPGRTGGELSSPDVTFQVSELHLCADIAGLLAGELDPEHFVHRGRVARWVQEDADILDMLATAPTEPTATIGSRVRPMVEVVARYGERETLTFSRGAPHEAAIYNKPREIRYHSRDKLWFTDLWRRNGWDGQAPITRVEMRYGREALHELGCEGVEVTFDRHDALWAYSTREWLRHTVPDPTEPRRSLWPVSPWWQAVQFAHFGTPQTAPAQRQRVHTFQEERILATILGYLESWTAWRAGEALPKDPNDLTIDRAISDLVDRAEVHYQQRHATFADQVLKKRRLIGYAK